MIKVTESSFRKLGHAEGLSLLILLFIAMPLKYYFGQPMAVRIVGMIHGILFLLYIFAGLIFVRTSTWSLVKLGAAIIITLVPFGPFIFDRKLFPKA